MWFRKQRNGYLSWHKRPEDVMGRKISHEKNIVFQYLAESSLQLAHKIGTGSWEEHQRM